jgi:hypothetical protein
MVPPWPVMSAAAVAGVDILREIVADGVQPEALLHAAAPVKVRAGRERSAELPRRRKPEIPGRAQRQRRIELPGDILRDDREALRGQVERVAVEQVAAGIDQARRRNREDRADQPFGDPVGGRVGRDLLKQQLAVEIMDDRAVGGIAREHRLKPREIGIGEGATDLLGGQIVRDLRGNRAVQRQEADRRVALRDQAIKLDGRTRRRRGSCGRCICKRDAGRLACRKSSLLVEARVVAADRHREKVAAGECRRRIREYRRLRPHAEELVDLILQALAAERRGSGRIEGIEAQGAVVGSAEGAADGEILDGNVEDGRERIDIIGSARESLRRIDRQRLRVGIAERERIAGIRIAVAERDDALDLLRRCRR